MKRNKERKEDQDRFDRKAKAYRKVEQRRRQDQDSSRELRQAMAQYIR